MILMPKSDIDCSRCADFMRLRCALRYSDETRYLVWLRAGRLAWCVAFEGWLGTSCRVHVARDPHLQSNFIPRELMHAVFDYAFNYGNMQLLFGVVSGEDEHVLKLDKWLGFVEVARFPGVHEHGHDLVLLTMWRHQCKLLGGNRHGRKRLDTTCA